MEKAEELQKLIGNLKPYQKTRLEDILTKLSVVNKINPESDMLKDMQCRNCGGEIFVKNGHSPGKRQRYKCKACGSTQSVDANTPLYCLKYKDKWADFVFIMLDNQSDKTCENIAKKIDVEIKTVLTWRHKFSTALSKVKPLEIEDEVEIDEIYLPFCVKGVIGKEKYDVWIAKGYPDNQESEFRKEEKNKEEENAQSIFLCLHNRNGDFDFFPIKVHKKGIVSKADLEKILGNIDLKNKTLITDSEPSMKACISNIKGANHLTFKSYEVKEGILRQKNVHNNHINGLMKMAKDWLKQFNGVSTKYLTNYLKWFRFLRLFDFEQIRKFVKHTIEDKMAYLKYKNTFDTYKAFASS